MTGSFLISVGFLSVVIGTHALSEADTLLPANLSFHFVTFLKEEIYFKPLHYFADASEVIEGEIALVSSIKKLEAAIDLCLGESSTEAFCTLPELVLRDTCLLIM